jgi:release factor glutamine methyltransferase
VTAVTGEAKVGAALSETTARLAAAGCVSAEAEARWLLEEAVGIGPGTLPARRAEPLPQPAATRLERMVARRVAGEPLQYVIGWAPFGPLRLEVGPGVFVPRPETEIVAERAARHLAESAGGSGGLSSEARAQAPGSQAEPSVAPRVDPGSGGLSSEARAGTPGSQAEPSVAPRWDRGSAPVAVDLCTGSGAIACFLAEEVPGARVLATEIDPGALAWARRNLRDRPVELLEGDLDEPLPADLEGGVDVLVANVPYVPASAMLLLPRDVHEHEPRVALEGGPDGLDVLRRVVARAPHWLAPGGWLVCEIGADQGEAAAALLEEQRLVAVGVRPDLAGRDRVVEGRRA